MLTCHHTISETQQPIVYMAALSSDREGSTFSSRPPSEASSTTSTPPLEEVAPSSWIPSKITFDDLVAHALFLDPPLKDETAPTTDQIQQMIEELSPQEASTTLWRWLKLVQIEEARSNRVDEVRRKALADASRNLPNGPDSLSIYILPPIPFSRVDPDYQERARSLLEGCLLLYPHDIIPNSKPPRRLDSMLAPTSLSLEIPIEGPNSALLIPRRGQLHGAVLRGEQANINHFSEQLAARGGDGNRATTVRGLDWRRNADFIDNQWGITPWGTLTFEKVMQCRNRNFGSLTNRELMTLKELAAIPPKQIKAILGMDTCPVSAIGRLVQDLAVCTLREILAQPALKSNDPPHHGATELSALEELSSSATIDLLGGRANPQWAQGEAQVLRAQIARMYTAAPFEFHVTDQLRNSTQSISKHLGQKPQHIHDIWAPPTTDSKNLVTRELHRTIQIALATPRLSWSLWIPGESGEADIEIVRIKDKSLQIFEPAALQETGLENSLNRLYSFSLLDEQVRQLHNGDR